MIAEFFRVDTSLGTASVGPDGIVVFSTPQLRKVFDGMQVVTPGTLKKLSVTDGEAFLKVLPFNFRNQYFYCKVKEESDGK